MAIIRSTKGTCSPLTLGASPNVTVQPAQVSVTIENGVKDVANNSCGGVAGQAQTACYQVDPQTGRPIDPVSGKPYLGPTRKPGDPPPTQTTISDPGTDSSGGTTLNPSPTNPTNDTPPAIAPSDKLYRFPCTGFLEHGPDSPSFTYANLDVTDNIKSAVQTVLPDYDPTNDQLLWVGMDCEGISYMGVGTPLATLNTGQTWQFTDQIGTKIVKYVVDHRGLLGYSILVRMDSDNGIGLDLSDNGRVYTSGNFAQSPNMGGIGPVGAAYSRAAICQAIIRKTVSPCQIATPYEYTVANGNSENSCWGANFTNDGNKPRFIIEGATRGGLVHTGNSLTDTINVVIDGLFPVGYSTNYQIMAYYRNDETHKIGESDIVAVAPPSVVEVYNLVATVHLTEAIAPGDYFSLIFHGGNNSTMLRIQILPE